MHDKPVNNEINIIKNIFAKSLTESVNNSEKNNAKEINEGWGQALARLFGRGAIGAAKVARTAGAAVDAGAASAAARAKAAGEAVTAGIKGTGEAVAAGARRTGEAVGAGVRKAGEAVASGAETVAAGARRTGEAVGAGVQKAGEAVGTVTKSPLARGVAIGVGAGVAGTLGAQALSGDETSTEPKESPMPSRETESPSAEFTPRDQRGPQVSVSTPTPQQNQAPISSGARKRLEGMGFSPSQIPTERPEEPKPQAPPSQLDRELGGMSPTERLSAMQKRWDAEKAENFDKKVDAVSKKVDEFGVGLTKPWNVGVSTPSPKPKMSEKQIADSILKTITDIANKQAPKEIVNKMNDPSRGGQSGRFGGDNTTVAYSGPFSQRGSEESKPTLVSSSKKPNYYNALFEKLERLEEATQEERAEKYVQSRGFNVGGPKGGVVVKSIKPSKLKKHLDTIEDYPGGEPTETGGEEEIGTNTRLDPDWFTHKAVVSLMTNAQTTGVELSHGEAMRMATEMLEQHRQNPSLYREFLPEPGEKRPQFPDPMENLARFAKKINKE